MKPPKPGGPHRYAQLARIIRRIRPKTIVEVGTHRATRAEFMVRRALWYQRRVTYTGFDIFEGGDAAFHRAALNGKGIPTEKRAREVLDGLVAMFGARFSYELVVGDTRETLAGRTIAADLVFIDGDHRLETIRSDHAALAGSKCIVFDDYLLPGANGELPDLDVYGANRLVDSLPGAGLLPVVDRAKEGWSAAFAVVERGAS